MESVKKAVKKLREEKYEKLVSDYNVDLYRGSARFTSPNKIEVDGREIQGEKFLIATGSRPLIPKIPGIEQVNYYTTDTIWNLREKPSRMLVVGSGAVGLELSQAFNRVGLQVDVVEVLDRPMPSTEPEISYEISKILSEEGVRFFFKSRVSKFKGFDGSAEAEIVGPEGRFRERYDAVLLATGRRPNTDDLALEKAEVEVSERGFIKVSPSLKTSNSSIYAAGDVAATPKPALLETLAAKEGALAALNMATGSNATIDYDAVPVVVFTDPELAFVGRTEEQVVGLIGACGCRVVRFQSLPKSSILGRNEGVAKLVIDPYNQVIKGFHVLSPNASEFIIGAALAIKHRYTVQDLLDLIHVFPTSAEILKLAAQAFIRRVEKMPCCVE